MPKGIAQPSGTFVRQLPFGGSPGVFIVYFIVTAIVVLVACFSLQLHHCFILIISSVQTCCLYCHFGRNSVRLTVTADSFNLLSLLSLLELLSLVCRLWHLTQQFTFAFNLTPPSLIWTLDLLSTLHRLLFVVTSHLLLLIGLLFVLTLLTVSCLSSLSPYGCRTLREPATGASTPHAFKRSCAHTPFASTLLWDEPTP